MKYEITNESSDAVVLLSGGQDSTTCLFWAKNKFERIIAISYKFGQKHINEIECAKKICDSIHIEHTIFDLSLLEKFKDNQNFICGRNMFFIMFGALIAKQKNIKNIILGISQQDISNFPDCCDNFVKSLNVSLNLGMDFEFNVITPLIDLNKKQIWELADNMGVVDTIINNTLTCYNGIKGKGCGICLACKNREKGYREYIQSKREE